MTNLTTAKTFVRVIDHAGIVNYVINSSESVEVSDEDDIALDSLGRFMKGESRDKELVKYGKPEKTMCSYIPSSFTKWQGIVFYLIILRKTWKLKCGPGRNGRKIYFIEPRSKACNCGRIFVSKKDAIVIKRYCREILAVRRHVNVKFFDDFWSYQSDL